MANNESSAIDEQQKAVQLTQAKNASKKPITDSEAWRSQPPQQKMVEFFQQQYGAPTEADDIDLSESDDYDDFNDLSDSDNQNEEGYDNDYNDEADLENYKKNQPNADGSDEEMDEMENLDEYEQYEKLMNQRSKLIQQIKQLDQEKEKTLEPTKKKLKASQTLDRTKNLVRIIKYLGGIGVGLWYTIIIPLLMILLILGVCILYLAGFNLGKSSLITKQLKQKMATESKSAEDKKQSTMKSITPQLTQINQKINQLF